MKPRRSAPDASTPVRQADQTVSHVDGLEIGLSNEQSLLSIDEQRLRDMVSRVLLDEGITAAKISVALVDDAAIHALNRQYLNHDYPTDVLSFRLDDDPDPAEIDGDRPAVTLEGEIVISVETALLAASEMSTSGESELALYLVHGLLHLCGYDDHTPEDVEQIRQRERSHLQNWGIQPHYAD